MGLFLLENQLCLFRPFVCNSAEKGSVFHTFPIKNGMISRFLLIIPQRPVRESNPHLVLRRAPTYCHSLSIWGKVNPYGTLYKTVSDSIRVILNTPSVKLCKALKVSWLFAPANNRGMPWYYHRHLLYDHHASYVRSW